MSDESVAHALRSDSRFVVVEAPGGCGKTYQGADYARWAAERFTNGRILILTHTHAACGVFASRIGDKKDRVDVRTVDGLIGQIASAYHTAIDLPKDTGTWARCRKDGYSQLAVKVAALLRASPVIARSLAERYPVIVCDEHQDASPEQHAIAIACHNAGAALRIFCDPMQSIYGGQEALWAELRQKATVADKLDRPHRWLRGFEELGQWILSARATLRDGGRIDLRGKLPSGLSVIFAENQSPRWGGLQWASDEAKPLYDLERQVSTLLVLAADNATVNSLRGLFKLRMPIWEGHVRDSLSRLVLAAKEHAGDCRKIATACVAFLEAVSTGFTATAYSKKLLDEVDGGCKDKRRGKPAALQSLGRLIIDHPNHKGVAKFIGEVSRLIRSDPAFKPIRIDRQRELFDAMKLGDFDDPEDGFAEILRRWSFACPAPPQKAISTIHKAKGLEFANVLIASCDGGHFKDHQKARCLLYVALSRATESLTLVVSRSKPCPLLAL